MEQAIAGHFEGTRPSRGGGAATEGSSPARLRLQCLDGIRGLAALYVVCFHVGRVELPMTETLKGRGWRILDALVRHGHDAVVVFIVLSGFVLMLPVARSADKRLKGGLPEYFRRRAARILPPYFAALIISLALGLAWFLLVMLPAGSKGAAKTPNPFVHDAAPASILSHVLLVHNLSRRWALSVDSPMWSVATEWQIYFLFPLVLLPLWRRWGMGPALAAAFVLGMIPVYLAPQSPDLDTWCPWFACLFAMGMGAAAIGVAARRIARLSAPGIWGLACLLAMLALGLAEAKPHGAWGHLELWYKDLGVGFVVSLLLIYLLLAEMRPTARRPLVSRALSSRWIVLLGAFSYSLYLVHHPIVDAVDVLLGEHLGGARHVIALYALGVAASLLCAYHFHTVFERPDLLERLARLWRSREAAVMPFRTGRIAGGSSEWRTSAASTNSAHLPPSFPRV